MPAKLNPLSSTVQSFELSPAADDGSGGHETCVSTPRANNDGDLVIEIPCETINRNSDASTTTVVTGTIGEQPVSVGIIKEGDTTTLAISFCGHSSTCEIPTHLYKIFVPTPDDVIRLVGNFFRDGPWALIAAANWMINFSVIPSSLDTNAAFWEATKAQWLWSSVTAGLPMAVLCFALKKYEYEVDVRKTIAGFMALSLAIVPWNWGQFKCAQDFLNERGLHYEKAGYAASVCTGALEGPLVQFALYTLLLLALGENNPQDSMRERYWRYFNNGVCHGALHFTLYLLVNLLINPIAGGNWQLAYNALFPYCNSNATNTSASACTVEPTPSNLTAVFFAVAFTVLTSNYLVSATSIAFDLLLNKWLPLKSSEDAASPANVDAADSVAGATIPVPDACQARTY